MNLNEFSKVVQMVVNFPRKQSESCVLLNLKDSADLLFNQWAFIVHDKDVDDNGKPKTKHIHLVGALSGRSRRLSSTLNLFCEKSLIPQDCVSILPAVSLNRALRYLCHLDNPNKFQYPVDDVKTSSLSWLFSQSRKQREIDVDYLAEIVKESDGDMLQICRILGLADFNKYKAVIKAISDSALREKAIEERKALQSTREEEDKAKEEEKRQLFDEFLDNANLGVVK